MQADNFSNQYIESLFLEVNEKIKKIVDSRYRQNIVPQGRTLMFPKALADLKKEGVSVPYLIDCTPSLQGKFIEDVEIVAPNDPRLNSDRIIMGCIVHLNTLKKSYKDEKREIFSYAQYLMYKYYNDYIKVRDNFFEDDKSKLIYNMAMYVQLTGDLHHDTFREVFEKDQYFALPEFNELLDEHIVDAGAFVGDTLEKYIWHSYGSSYYYCFEPGDKSFSALQKRKVRLCNEWAMEDEQIFLIKSGVGKKQETLHAGTKIRTGMELVKSNDFGIDKIQIVSLDDFFGNKPVTLIKADIEGMELDLIEGAKNLIKNQKPKISICVYHTPNDLFQIPLRLKELNPEYKFALRAHACNYNELVLYCY